MITDAGHTHRCGSLRPGHSAGPHQSRRRAAIGSVPGTGGYIGGPALQAKELGALSKVVPLLT